MMRLLTAVDGQWLVFDNHDLAKAIIKSPCPIYRVEVFSHQYGNRWLDITYKYAEYIEKGNAKMSKKITTLPAYAIGEVIDLSYKHGGMPNRIYVDTVFWREQDTRWNYQVIMENTGEKTIMSEDFIKDRKAKNSSPVCKNPDIIKRFSDGWRFCGNFEKDTAVANGKLIAENPNVRAVRLYPALNYNNQYMNGKLGIWIKYTHTIYDDGRFIDQCMMAEFVDLK